jgi:hypothetical protein
MSIGLSSSAHFLPFGSSNLLNCFTASKHTSTVTSVACLARYLGNSALQGATLYSVLELMGNSLALALCMLGYRPIETMRNPLLRSLSPRDFWGKRWNLIVHGVLKVKLNAVFTYCASCLCTLDKCSKPCHTTLESFVSCYFCL